MPCCFAAFCSSSRTSFPNLLLLAAHLTTSGALHHSAGSVNGALLGLHACAACRQPQGGPSLPDASLLRVWPEVEFGRLRPAQGAVVRGKSRTTSSRACRPSSPSEANSSRHRRVRGCRSNPRTLALPPAMAPSPRHRSHFSFVRPLPRSDCRDFSGSRGSFWPALAEAVPPAAPPPPPPRLRALVFERVRLAVWAAADRAETVCRGAPWVLGRTVPVSSC